MRGPTEQTEQVHDWIERREGEEGMVEILALDGLARIRGVLEAKQSAAARLEFKSSRPTWTTVGTHLFPKLAQPQEIPRGLDIFCTTRSHGVRQWVATP